MAIELGKVSVPMQITISAGSPARDIGTVTTEMKLGVTGKPRPIGADGITVQPAPESLRAAVVRALRKAADDIETQAGPPERLAADRDDTPSALYAPGRSYTGYQYPVPPAGPSGVSRHP